MAEIILNWCCGKAASLQGSLRCPLIQSLFMSCRGHTAKHLAKCQPYNVISGNRGAWSHQDSLTAPMVCPCHPCSFCPSCPCPSPPRLDGSLMPPPVPCEQQLGQHLQVGKDPYHQVLFNHLPRIHLQLVYSHITPQTARQCKYFGQAGFPCSDNTQTTLHHAKRPNFPFSMCLHLSVPGWSDSRILS